MWRWQSSNHVSGYNVTNNTTTMYQHIEWCLGVNHRVTRPNGASTCLNSSASGKKRREETTMTMMMMTIICSCYFILLHILKVIDIKFDRRMCIWPQSIIAVIVVSRKAQGRWISNYPSSIDDHGNNTKKEKGKKEKEVWKQSRRCLLLLYY